MVVFTVIFFVLAVLCAVKESKITGTYKANKVYGRITAYLSLDFVLVGVMCLISVFVPPLQETIGMGFPGNLLMAVVMLALAALLFWNALRKCPPALKKKCIPSMLISGMGVTLKLCVFFLPFVWKLSGAPVSVVSIPELVTDANGNCCRAMVNGDFIDITRPDGSVVSVRKDYIDVSSRRINTSTGELFRF